MNRQGTVADFITLTAENIDSEHICCALSDKNCRSAYLLKKEWLKEQIKNGYVFRRLNARAKVFIEYGPAETGWMPVHAPGYLLINCLWVSGKYKNCGLGKALLQTAVEDAVRQGKHGLVTVTGIRKFHFMSDAGWLLRQGFEVTKRLSSGFVLLVKKTGSSAPKPSFNASAVTGTCSNSRGLTAYYSDRCPFAEFHVTGPLQTAAASRGIPLEIIKLNTIAQAQAAPSPATVFSLFFNGRFITTDLGVCTSTGKFDRVVLNLKG